MNRVPASELVLVPGGTLITATQVVATEFATIAAANNYWR